VSRCGASNLRGLDPLAARRHVSFKNSRLVRGQRCPTFGGERARRSSVDGNGGRSWRSTARCVVVVHERAFGGVVGLRPLVLCVVLLFLVALRRRRASATFGPEASCRSAGEISRGTRTRRARGGGRDDEPRGRRLGGGEPVNEVAHGESWLSCTLLGFFEAGRGPQRGSVSMVSCERLSTHANGSVSWRGMGFG